MKNKDILNFLTMSKKFDEIDIKIDYWTKNSFEKVGIKNNLDDCVLINFPDGSEKLLTMNQAVDVLSQIIDDQDAHEKAI